MPPGFRLQNLKLPDSALFSLLYPFLLALIENGAQHKFRRNCGLCSASWQSTDPCLLSTRQACRDCCGEACKEDSSPREAPCSQIRPLKQSTTDGVALTAGLYFSVLETRTPRARFGRLGFFFQFLFAEINSSLGPTRPLLCAEEDTRVTNFPPLLGRPAIS